MLRSKRRLLLCYVMFLLAHYPAHATGIQCDLTLKLTEKSICSQPALLRLDQQLGKLYAALNQLQPKQKDQLQSKQQQWLISRNQCAEQTACIDSRYAERISELRETLAALTAYQPDHQDHRALNTLHDEVNQQRKSNPEFALENALKKFEIKEGITHFENVTNKETQTLAFPTQRPAQVTPDEWNALVNSAIDAEGEHGHGHYTLLDMNLDGKRDLIVDTYIGGTGLYNYISTLTRKGDQFIGRYATQNNLMDDYSAESDTSESTRELFAINGRGGNQEATWVTLQGRIYVAYRDSHFGVDRVYLMRPLHRNLHMLMLTVHYQYTFNIALQQIQNDGKTPYTLDATTHAALMQSLHQVKQPTTNTPNKPLCPTPSNLTEDERVGYASYGPGHYTYETVVDVPIWIKQTCYIGRLANWFGRYSPQDGLYAQLWMNLPNQDMQTASYDVVGRRKMVKLSMGKGRLDN